MFPFTKPATSSKPSTPSKSLDEQIAELETQLATVDDTAAMGLYRSFCESATILVDNIVDIIYLIPPATPFAPVLKLAFAVFVLIADGKAATEALEALMERLVKIHKEILPLRAKLEALKDLLAGMERILSDVYGYVTKHFKKTTWNLVKGFKKSKVIGKVQYWTSQVDELQRDHIVPALSRLKIAANIVSEAVVRTAGVAAEVHQATIDNGQVGLETRDAVLKLVPKPPQVISRLKGLPYNLDLIGREQDLDRALDLLTKSHGQASSQHVALVGPGGIGKTSLATKIAYESRSLVLGQPVFIRCEQLDTLVAFQTELLRLRAPDALHPGEDLEQAVLELLEAEPFLLILDNLLDSSDGTAHATYLEFIDSITSIPSLTLLITSRNHVFVGRNTPRKIRGLPLKGLSDGEAEALFRATHADALGEGERSLEPNEPSLTELLQLLDGMPLAIVLVAAHARKADSLEEVVRRWKEGRASDNGAQGRTTSVDFSLKLSFSDPSINKPDTLTLLRLLAELPDPVLRGRFTSSEIISRAFDVIVERSIGQLEDSRAGKVIRILQPTREYILRHHSPLDSNSDVVRTFARKYFKATIAVGHTWTEDEIDNISALTLLTANIKGDKFESARNSMMLSLGKSIHDECSGIRIISWKTLLTHATGQGKQHKLNVLYERNFKRTGVEYAELDQLEEACDIYEMAGDFFLRLKDYDRAASFLWQALELQAPGKSLAELVILRAKAACALLQAAHVYLERFFPDWGQEWAAPLLEEAAFSGPQDDDGLQESQRLRNQAAEIYTSIGFVRSRRLDGQWVEGPPDADGWEGHKGDGHKISRRRSTGLYFGLFEVEYEEWPRFEPPFEGPAFEMDDERLQTSWSTGDLRANHGLKLSGEC